MIEGFDNIPRFFTALAECSACVTLGMALPKKVSRMKFVIGTIILVIIQCALLILTEHARIYFWVPVMVIAVLFMLSYLYFICDTSLEVVVYFGLKAFIVAEFIASFEWQMAYYLHNFIEMNLGIHLALLIFFYTVLLTIVYVIEKSMISSDFSIEISTKELVSVILIVIAIFSVSNLTFVLDNSPFSGGELNDNFNVRTLVDLGGLAILYAYQSRIFELQTEKELMAIHTVLQSQYADYRNYSESIELINLKYHDLKHQIAGLRAEMSEEKRGKWLDAIEEELEVYQPEQQTGNYILDTIIAGKLNSCGKRKIKFTCVADGKILEFMHVTDVCNIFGNALDNAIENVSLVEAEEKRIVHMKVFQKHNMVFISVSNYCEQKMKLKNGFPVTTKKDKSNHGFGMKSIDLAVKKYGGNLYFGIKDDMFELKIIIPKNDTACSKKVHGS